MYKEQNLQYLQDIFDRLSNDIAVLYGHRSCGLSETLRAFIKDKECLYYRAGAVKDDTQRILFAAEVHEQTRSPILPTDDYEKLISSFIGDLTNEKKVIVLDDFQLILKENPTFINFLAGFLSERCEKGSVMFLLISEDIRWVEKDMIRLVGRKSSEISGVVKLNEFTPSEFSMCFPQMPIQQLIGIYSYIGGKCGYYDGITDDSTLRDVVITHLERYSVDDFDTDRYLPSEIREPQLYNTILFHIAAGTGKLGDLYELTGIDRAKLSVYIKALIETDMVEKTGTAFYRIKDRYIRFYYRFVYPHISSLYLLGAERFYRRFVEHEIMGFIEEAYPIFGMEQIRWLMANNRLNFKVSNIEEYHDKNKAIDFLIVAAGGNTIACACRYGGPHMSYKTYELVKASVRKNKLACDNIWLFSASGFDQKLTMFGSVTPGVKLIDGADQRLH